MSTLVGIKRVESSPITTEELDALIPQNPALSWESEEKACLQWDAEGTLTFFNFGEGEIWSVETPDDACLRKIHQLAKSLNAAVVDESGEIWEAEEISEVSGTLPEEKKSTLFRVYVALLIAGAIAWYFYSRR